MPNNDDQPLRQERGQEPSHQASKVGERIKRARRSAGLTQQELAFELSVTDKAISTYETGRAEPSFKTMRKISEITQRPVTYFMADLEPPEDNVPAKLKQIAKELKEIKQMLAAQKAQ